MDGKGVWALVTGASGGMGADLARELAGRGYGVVLAARRVAEMEALAEEIRGKAPDARLKIVPCDLGRPESIEGLLSATAGLDVELLANNAGFGAYGPFDAISDDKEGLMLAVDIAALVRLTKAFAARMKARGRGFILQTASIAAFQPCPLYGSYGAAKSFVLNYGLAVREELRGSGVSLTVLCPGVTRTGFFDAASQASLSRYQRSSMQESMAVVRGALKALFRGKAVYVPGFANRMNAFATRFVPRTLAARIARGLMESGTSHISGWRRP
jgi:hypothetical protein